jgi:beta-glucanase (GH16 family)
MNRSRSGLGSRQKSLLKWGFVLLCVGAVAVLVVELAGRAVQVQAGASTHLSTTGRKLIVEETFDGPAGAPANPAYFGYDLGAGGWGNDEKQTYTRSPENVRLSGDGQLIIEIHRTDDGYSSARLVTRGRAALTTGLLEARIKMPQGNGLHPAFWLLGANIETVGYPQSGEIDIIEIVDSGAQYHNAIHGPRVSDPSIQWQQSHDGEAVSNLADDYHTYQVYRDTDSIQIGIDGKDVGEYSRASIPPDARWVFDAPMYLILNIAVGGLWPSPVDESTQFPAAMHVDWIRFWL